MRLPIALLMLIIFSLSTAQSQNDYWFQRTLEGSSVVNPGGTPRAMAYHEGRDEILLIPSSRDMLWIRDAIAWQQVTTTTGDSDFAVMAYDSDRKKPSQ